MKKKGKLVKSIIKEINSNFDENELAYLALTSKIENPLRDKIAFELQKKIGSSNIICREWNDLKQYRNRVDLAILDRKGNPECLVEFKAHSSISGIQQWAKEIINDLEKNKQYENQNTEMIFVLFANHHKSLPENKIFEHSIKYCKELSKSTKNWSIDKMSNSFENKFKSLVLSSNIDKYLIDAGTYESVDVQIQTFILENIKLK